LNQNLKTWKFIQKSIDQGWKVILLYVLESKGSSPGRQGFFMAVNDQGNMAGSIGGGIMEHKFVELAKSILTNNSETNSVHLQVHSKSAPEHQSGMICSGEQTIFLHDIHEREKVQIVDLVSNLENKNIGWLYLSPEGIRFSVVEYGNVQGLEMNSVDDWKFQIKIGEKPIIHIIGGGHCSLALSKLMDFLDFEVHVYEDRPDLNTFVDNSFATKKVLVKHYSELSTEIPQNENHFVVVMTFGYRTDDQVIRALKDWKFAFLGVLGSRKKIEKMRMDYHAEGFDSGWLQSISAPVGLPIKSQTPEQIAVSIAAEIIGVMNKDLK